MAQTAPNATPPRYADYRTPLIRNAWYVAGLASELDGDLVARRLVGEDVVLFRTPAGRVVVLQDRCRHRSFPLSKGYLDGESVVCGYHGMAYGPDGGCTALPAGGRPAPQVRVGSYKAVVRGPLVWVWMGDQETADEDQIPSHEWIGAPGWTAVSGYFGIPSNYLAMHENLMDLTHFSYLHSDTVGTPEYAASPYEVVTDGMRVQVKRCLKASPPPPLFGVPMGLMGRDVDRYSDANFVGPGAHIAYASIVNPQPREGERDVYRVHFLHAITPADQDHLHYWWFLSRDFAQDDEAVSDFLAKGGLKAFNEDVEALTLIAERLRSGGDFDEMSFATDRPGMAMKRSVQLLAMHEHGDKTT